MSEIPDPLEVLSYDQKEIEIYVPCALSKKLAAIPAENPPSNFHPKFCLWLVLYLLVHVPPQTPI